MRNLEIKLRLTKKPENLTGFFVTTLHQTDTYFSCPDGRLKLREEQGLKPYFIRYSRENTETQKLSEYFCHTIDSVPEFMKVFSPLLHKELVISKRRDLYRIENARIHVDHVEELGWFMEIEVVINTVEEDLKAGSLLSNILYLTKTEDAEKVAVGYRELLLQKLEKEKNVAYFLKDPKMFWVVNKDIPPYVKANDIVPALFVEEKDGQYKVLQLDLSIKDDGFRYTMWRKMVGQELGFNCQVLLMLDNQTLIDLKGEKVNPASLSRSEIHVHKSYLARFA